jgi:hypothetical protein
MKSHVVAFPVRAAPLSVGEKAALFDLAMCASSHGMNTRPLTATRRLAMDLAPLVAVLATSYVALRDREDGIV